MKDIDFVSKGNGLHVAIPADAVPNPACGNTMCKGSAAASFVCETALTLSGVAVRATQRYPLIFEAIEGQTIVEMAGGSWSAGEAPDGVPNNYVALEAGNNGDGDGYFLFDVAGGVAATPAPHVTITAPDGTVVLDADLPYQGSGVFSVTLDVPLAVVAGVEYCVAIDTTGASIA